MYEEDLEMTKAATWGLVAVGLIGVAAGAIYICSSQSGGDRQTHVRGQVSSLEQWIERSQRPGFTLLDKADLDEYYIGVYVTDTHEVALCYWWKLEVDEPDTSLMIRDSDDRNAQDPSRWNVATPLNATGLIPENEYVKGMVIPIDSEHRGAIQVDFQDNYGDPDAVPARTVYAKTLDFGE